MSRTDYRKQHRGRWLVAGGLVVVAACAWVAARYLTAYVVPTSSMRNSIQCGDRLLVIKSPASVQVGDVVVLHAVSGGRANGEQLPVDGPHLELTRAERLRRKSNELLVKRVVAVGGDTVSVRRDVAIVNGKREAGPSYKPSSKTPSIGYDDIAQLKVPEHDVYVMGDNRRNSIDSRSFGPVPLAFVTGRAIAVYWPIRHLGAMRRTSDYRRVDMASCN